MADDSADAWHGVAAALFAAVDESSDARAKALRRLAKMQPPVDFWLLRETSAFRELILLCARDEALEIRLPALYALGNIAAVDPESPTWCLEECQYVLIESAEHGDKYVSDSAWRCVLKLVECHGESMWANDRFRRSLVAGAAGKLGGSAKSQQVQGRCLATLKALAMTHSSTWRQMWQQAGAVLRSAAMNQALASPNRCNALRTLCAVAHDTNRREMWADQDFRTLLLAGKIFDTECTRVIFDIYSKLATDPQTAMYVWQYSGTKAMFQHGVSEGGAEVLSALVVLTIPATNQATIWQDMGALLLEIVLTEAGDSRRKELALEAVAKLSECCENGHLVWRNSRGDAKTWLLDYADAQPGGTRHTGAMKALALRAIANSIAQGQNVDAIFRLCRLKPVAVLRALLTGSEDASLDQEARACALCGVASIVRTVDDEKAVKNTVCRAKLQLAGSSNQDALLCEGALKVLERAQVSIQEVWSSSTFITTFLSCLDEASPMKLRMQAFRVLAVLVTFPAICPQIWSATTDVLFLALYGGLLPFDLSLGSASLNSATVKTFEMRSDRLMPAGSFGH